MPVTNPPPPVDSGDHSYESTTVTVAGCSSAIPSTSGVGLNSEDGADESGGGSATPDRSPWNEQATAEAQTTLRSNRGTLLMLAF